jgi:hypothetical protein
MIAKIGDLVEVIWLDTALRIKLNKEEHEACIPSDLLETTSSFGKVYAEDEVALTLIQNENEDTFDLITIPIGTIVDINLKGGIE